MYYYIFFFFPWICHLTRYFMVDTSLRAESIYKEGYEEIPTWMVRGEWEEGTWVWGSVSSLSYCVTFTESLLFCGLYIYDLNEETRLDQL